jgi:hypothetical protein
LKRGASAALHPVIVVAYTQSIGRYTKRLHEATVK